MLSTTKTILMNKVISHLYHIYITSPLLKKRFGYKLFGINFYFSSSQYYRTLDKTLAIQLSLHLICFIIRLYSCNSNRLSLIFILHFFNTCDGIVISKHHDWMKCTTKCFKGNNKASHFFSIVDIFFVFFVKRLRKIAIRQIYVIFTFLEQNCTKTCITSIHC
jgi:hypothetical protein